MKLNRRRTILGLGGLCAAGGAAIGTGALTSVEATRTVDINVEGDSNAFVGLYATSSSSFVDTNATDLRIRLNGDFGGSGSGVNHGGSNGEVATTTLVPAFTLANQGPDTMYVRIDHGAVTGSGNDAQFIADDRSNGTSPRDGTANDVIASGTDVAFFDRDGTGTAVTTSIHSGGTTTSVPEGGYLTMPSGTKVDVILQVASDSASTAALLEKATIEAFDDSSASAISGWTTVTAP